jgi:RND family efflux transporter MFP subunit
MTATGTEPDDSKPRTEPGRGGGALLPAVLAALALATCGGPEDGPAAQEDHEHGGGAVVTTWTDSLELFMEHPPQVAGATGDPWAVHLTRLRDWTPVREGTLTLYFTGPEGSVHTARSDAPARAGIFTPAPTLPVAGEYRLEMVLESRGRRHEIPVGPVTVYAGEDELPHPTGETAGGGISFLKERQWEVPFGVAEVERRQLPASVRASGELAAPADRRARISAPVTGLVEVRGGATPAPGTWVEEGEVLAVLAPTDADASYARLRGRVERLEREVARAERLVEAEAIAEKRLVEARHELSVARSALEAIGGEPPAGTSDVGSGEGGGDGYRFHLRSPITGVVSGRSLSPGQRVEAGEQIFTVVDPRTLWLRLNVPADEAARASHATGATFRVEGSPTTHRAASVVSVGDVIDPESRTLPVILRVDNADRRLKVGMLARARLFVGDSVTGPAIPDEAVRDEEGLKVVYVETGGETFERRVLELGPTDGEWTLVRSGVSPGERVVTEGAYQVHLASTGGDEAAAGHGHPH